MPEITPLPRVAPADLPIDSPPALFVVVDTEEEFDWSAPFDRSKTSVTAMRHIDRTQNIFDRFGLRPIYIMDYAIVASPEGYEPLVQFWREGRCEIGAHLHPWITPPHLEEVNGTNSFTSNLPADAQRAKLVSLTELIEQRFAVRPRVFKAGRYGLGAATVAILDELGFEIDMSVSPAMDFSSSGGPSFVGFDAKPFFLTRHLLEIPCTIDYVGWLGPLRPVVHRAASARGLEALRAVGILSRLGAVNRIMLSPEGSRFDDMKALAKALYARGCRTFTLSFHSPSVEPGHTPYVRTNADLDMFLGDIERFCEFFMRDLHGTAVSPHLFRQDALRSVGYQS